MAAHRRNTVADVLGNVAHVNSSIGALLVEVLNQPDDTQQALQLRELGRYVDELSAELFARAADLDGRHLPASPTVIVEECS